ncbi:hypothetical protein [Corallococcus exiguus]|nr:hypothetical protein [Corallococcus exiguus]
MLDRPSGAREQLLLRPEVVLDDDPLHPRAAVDVLLSRPVGSHLP